MGAVFQKKTTTFYLDFKYYYPPRPEQKISREELDKYEKTGEWIAQPKSNGSMCEIFISPEGQVRNFGRHFNEHLNHFNMNLDEFRKLNTTGKWMILIGEFMNKNKFDADGKQGFNLVFVLFDIMVYDGVYLLGTTFQNRIELLDKLYVQKDFNEYYTQISENIYRARTYDSNFKAIWDKISETETRIKKQLNRNAEDDVFILEGLVLKKKYAKLEEGKGEKNNTLSQLKCRLPGKRNCPAG